MDKRRRGDLAPDAEMWEALEQGRKLRLILEDFYTVVYEDEQMSPFFHRVTKSRAIDKQYEFLRDKWLGTRDYFGDRPRNAHHWMVISDALFDYREDLLIASMRRLGLEEKYVQKWRALDELFRKQIVKSKPIPKKIRGRALPLEGYEDLTMEVGGMCDACQQVVDVGEQVRYHRRTGEMHCLACAPSVEAEEKDAS